MFKSMYIPEHNKTLEQILTFDGKCDYNLLDLAKKILKFDPDTRINIKQILEHPYFKEYHDPKAEIVMRKNIPVTRDYKIMAPLRQEMYDLIANIH